LQAYGRKVLYGYERFTGSTMRPQQGKHAGRTGMIAARLELSHCRRVKWLPTRKNKNNWSLGSNQK